MDRIVFTNTEIGLKQLEKALKKAAEYNSAFDLAHHRFFIKRNDLGDLLVGWENDVGEATLSLFTHIL